MLPIPLAPQSTTCVLAENKKEKGRRVSFIKSAGVDFYKES